MSSGVNMFTISISVAWLEVPLVSGITAYEPINARVVEPPDGLLNDTETENRIA